MTNAKKKQKIKEAIDLLKEEFNVCEDYCIGCFSCQVGRIIEDLECLKDLMKEW